MVINDFQGKFLFLDSAPLIYFIEGNSTFQNILLRLFASVDKKELFFLTSTITLLEVLVKPIKDGNKSISEKYIEILTTSSGIDIFDLNISVAKEAAQLRAKYSLRTPDAIQIATSLVFGADYFLTNDSRLKNVTEIKIVLLSDIDQFS